MSEMRRRKFRRYAAGGWRNILRNILIIDDFMRNIKTQCRLKRRLFQDLDASTRIVIM
jgi:hypothetical protein